jgi:curved DNA-binding protein
MQYRDYYEVMGLARDASQDDIKRAYRKLARKYHPDVSKEADAEDRFKELGEAYEVLKDPEKRAAYDRMGPNWKAGQEFQPPPGAGPGFDFGDRDFAGDPAEAGEFSDFFEELFGRRTRPRPDAPGPARPRADRPRGQLPGGAAQHCALGAGRRSAGPGEPAGTPARSRNPEGDS